MRLLGLKRYLEMISEQSNPGRRFSKGDLEERLAKTIDAIGNEDNLLTKLELTQRRMDLEKRINGLEDADDPADAEAEFIKVAQGYAERKGITYSAFRDVGVPATILAKTGVRRTRSSA